MTRTLQAWRFMKDGDGQDGAPPDLTKPFAQAGMSGSQSIVLLGFGGRDWTLERLDVLPDEGSESHPSRSAEGYKVSEPVRIGTTTRLDVTGLAHGTRYLATLRAGAETYQVESRTPPEKSESTSFLVTSCNEPWNRESVHDDRPWPGVPMGSANGLRLLELRATGKMPVTIRDGERAAANYARPKFLIGLGDQAYTDTEPEYDSSIALFGGDRSDDVRIDAQPEDWDRILDRVYRMHFQIPPFHRALKAIPNAMVWDDHEIRDGWGSQGDERRTMDGRTTWRQYFERAHAKVWEYEVARNPSAGGLAVPPLERGKPRDLDTQFAWGSRIDVFLLDTRSTRGPNQILSDAQLARATAWLAQPCGVPPRLLVLGVPVPLGMRREGSIGGFAQKVDNELVDDFRDEWWNSRGDRPRRAIEAAIDAHALNCPDDRILVVSGDVHESGLVAISAQRETGSKIIAYEVISSGIASLVRSKVGIPKHGLTAFATGYGASGDVRYSELGRVATGASFAEMFVDFPDAGSPVLKVLFHTTTDQENWARDNDLANAAPMLKNKTWSTGVTHVEHLNCQSLTFRNAAVALDYGILAPRSDDYGLMHSSERCLGTGHEVDDLATDWTLEADVTTCTPKE